MKLFLMVRVSAVSRYFLGNVNKSGRSLFFLIYFNIIYISISIFIVVNQVTKIYKRTTSGFGSFGSNRWGPTLSLSFHQRQVLDPFFLRAEKEHENRPNEAAKWRGQNKTSCHRNHLLNGLNLITGAPRRCFCRASGHFGKRCCCCCCSDSGAAAIGVCHWP